MAEQDAIGSESDRLALQDKLKRRLKRPGVAADDLLQISIQAGYGDPTKLPHNRILISTHAGRRTLLVEHLAEHLAYTADEDDDALGDEEDLASLEAWLSGSADAWPPTAPPLLPAPESAAGLTERAAAPPPRTSAPGSALSGGGAPGCTGSCGLLSTT